MFNARARAIKIYNAHSVTFVLTLGAAKVNRAMKMRVDILRVLIIYIWYGICLYETDAGIELSTRAQHNYYLFK